jgi:hypothetical protein
MKKVIKSTVLLILSGIILSCGKHEEYVDPYNFTVNQTVVLKPNTIALAIMADPIYSGLPMNYLLSILADGTVDTVRIRDTNGNDISELLIPMALENLNEDLTLITFARNTNAATDVYVLNKKTNSFIDVSQFGIPIGLQFQFSPVKSFVVNAENDSYYYISRTNNGNQRITELEIMAGAFTGSYITPDSMQMGGFDRDKDGNFWLSFFGQNGEVIVNKDMQKLSSGQSLPQRTYWLSANQTFNYWTNIVVASENIISADYDLASNTMAFPRIGYSSRFPYKGKYFRAKFSDYMYLFDYDVIVDDKSTITLLTSPFHYIVAADYSISTKTATIAASQVSGGAQTLYKVVMNNGVVTNSTLIASGLYEYYDIEVLESGDFYFSAKRLADNKIILAKSTDAGVVTVLSDKFTGKVGYIEKITEYTNKY